MDVPADIREKALAVVDRGYDVGLIDAVCQALLAERLAQRERDAKIAEDCPILTMTERAQLAAAIRVRSR